MRILLGKLEIMLGQLCPLDEQTDRFVLRKRLQRREMFDVRKSQRWNGKFLLAMQMQHHLAGDQHLQLGARRQQLGYRRGCFDNVLKVVQHEQYLLVAEVGSQILGKALPAGFSYVQSLGNSGDHEVGVTDRGQGNEKDPVAEFTY